MNSLLNSKQLQYFYRYKLYYLTFATSLSSLFAMLLLLGMFSRSFSEQDFLEFVFDIRVAGYMVSIVSFSLGFSIIKNERFYSLSEDVFPAAFWLVLLLFFVTSLFSYFVFDFGLYAFLWVLSGSIFHIYVSSLRTWLDHRSNMVTFLCKFVFVLLCGLLVVFFEGDGSSYFITYGFLLLFWIIFDSLRRKFVLRFSSESLILSRQLFSSSFSRAIDNILRSSFHILPVISSGVFFGDEAAGLISIAILVIKTLESALQPIVMQLHASRIKSHSNSNIMALKKIFFFSLFLSFLVFCVYASFGNYLLVAWLGVGYVSALQFVGVIIWGLPAMLSLQYCRGVFESQFNTSPFVVINFTVIVVFALLYFSIPLSLYEVSLIYVGAFWCRFISFLLLYSKRFKSFCV